MIFWRLAGGDEEELLALRVLLFDLVAIFEEKGKSKNYWGGHFVAGLAPENITENNGTAEWSTKRH